MNLFELFVKIGADDQASGPIGKLTEKLGNGLKTAAKVGTAAVATFTAATTALTTAFVKGTSEVAQYGDNIDKMSQKMGLSAEAYQEWDFIMQHSGTSIESLQAGMKTLANAVDSGNEAFERLGISQTEIAEMNQEELFAKTIEQLQKVEDTTERTYLAGQLLGRGATELGALLNTSAEDTEAMRKQVHELGGVLSNEAVKSAAAYQDSLQNMQTAFSGLKNNLMAEFLPSLVSVMDGLALIFSGDESGLENITDGIESLSDKLMKAVPKVLKLGKEIVSGLSKAITKNLPTLAGAGTDVVLQVVQGITSSLPQFAESALEIVESLTDGLFENIDVIADSAVELIDVLANGIVKMLPKITSVGLDLIVSFTRGIGKNLPMLAETATSTLGYFVEMLTDQTMLMSLVDAGLSLLESLAMGFINNLPVLLDAALTLIDALSVGLIDAAPLLIDSAITIVEKLVDFVTDEENLDKVLDLALVLVERLAQGLIDALPKLIDSAVALIMKLIDYILDEENLESLVETAVEIIMTIADALVKAIPMLVEAATEIILKLVDYLLDPENIGMLIDMAFEVVEAIVEGLLMATGALAEGALELMHTLRDKFMETDWSEVGKSIIDGIWDGIVAVWDSFTKRFFDLWETVKAGPLSNNGVGAHVGSRGFGTQGVGIGIGDAVLNAGATGLLGGTGTSANAGGVYVTQNIYSEAKTAADLMQEAIYQQERAVMFGV